ncbi:hypothetical protein EDB89DRAFT_1908777 [Lactarius sanguifluus]|nr:hypothetical protein EDB89DRAFT_1908777 [Lactarius sanguifluus]
MPNASSARPAAGTLNHGRRPAGGVTLPHVSTWSTRQHYSTVMFSSLFSSSTALAQGSLKKLIFKQPEDHMVCGDDATTPTRPASPAASLRHQHGGTQPCRVTTTPTQQPAGPPGRYNTDTAACKLCHVMSLRHWRDLQAPPPRYDTNTVARKHCCIATTRGLQALPPRYDTNTAARKRCCIAMTCGLQAPPPRYDTNMVARRTGTETALVVIAPHPPVPSVSLQYRHSGMQALLDATTMTRRHAGPATSLRHQHGGSQAPPCRYDTNGSEGSSEVQRTYNSLHSLQVVQ